MSTLTEGHTENCITGFKQSVVNCHIRLAAGVRLDVDVFNAEKSLRALNREGFNSVHELASVVVAFAGVAFGVFIGEDTGLGLHNGTAGIVL